MKIIDLEPNTPEWLTWRKNKICASDSGIILDYSPFTTRKELQALKLGFVDPKPPSKLMQRGHDLEPIAREIFEERMGLRFPPLIIESEKTPFMGASLDGMNLDNNLLLEIKCPGKINSHLNLLEEGQEISYAYFTQIQHQLYCAEAEMCFYVSYHPDDPDKIIVKEVFPDVEFTERMIEAERYFWEKNILLMEPVDI